MHRSLTIWTIKRKDLAFFSAEVKDINTIMADAVAFHAALERCDFKDDRSDELIDQGFYLVILASFEDDDIDGIIKNVCETRRTLGQKQKENSHFLFLPSNTLRRCAFDLLNLFSNECF